MAGGFVSAVHWRSMILKNWPHWARTSLFEDVKKLTGFRSHNHYMQRCVSDADNRLRAAVFYVR
jgi:hypothetical protein